MAEFLPHHVNRRTGAGGQAPSAQGGSVKTVLSPPSKEGAAKAEAEVGTDALETASQASGATSYKSLEASKSAKSAATSSASAPQPLGLDRKTLEGNREESRQKVSHATFKLVSQVLGAGFLLATLVTTAALCPPALVLVAPVCVFAGHVLFGEMSKTLVAREAAKIAYHSADSHLRALDGGDSERGGPAGLARSDSGSSQCLKGFDDEEVETPKAHRAPLLRDALTAPTSLDLVDQSCRSWLEAREAHKKSHAGLEASAERLRAAGAELRTHLETVDAA